MPFNFCMKQNQCSKKKRLKKTFNWKTFTYTQYLLKIAYVGTHYRGLAWQTLDESYQNKHPSGVCTIEGLIFHALKKTCLIPNRRLANFSRCGRTDKGVHASGNYLSLKLRNVSCTASNQYASLLNAILPHDIRIVECCAVEDNFDARFHCLYRIYKYFFVNEGYNIEEMKKACQYFVGIHNFQNFCKTDLHKSVNSIRTILWIKLMPLVDSLLWEIEIAGYSFLWQQIRRMVGLLFHIGKQYEKSDYVKYLLNGPLMKSTNVFAIAPQMGLVLYDCFFEGIHFPLSTHQQTSLQSIKNLYTQQLQLCSVLACLYHTPFLSSFYNTKPSLCNTRNSEQDKVEEYKKL